MAVAMAMGDGVHGNASTKADYGIPLFLFCCFRTTGTNLLIDEVSEVAVRCWPYQEQAPSFHYQILTEKSTFFAANCKKHGHLPYAVRELCLWIERTVREASEMLHTRLYPVLLAHGGDSMDFLFFFRSLAKYGLDLARMTKMNIHFADPVPLLELLKSRYHPLIIESRYLTLGSLLNDWFPGLFDPSELRHLPSRAALTARLYTQSTLYPVLYKVPIYNISEWTQYYQDAIDYKEDKRELEAHMPKHLKEVQVRFAVRAILRAGYNWPKLLELYKVCSSPLQFRQELRDIDVQSSIARAIAWMVTDMKLEQNGTRPYVLRIKKQMAPQEYIGYKDPRGYYFVLRVANKFPKCFLTLADLEFSLQDNPIDAPDGYSFSQRLSPKNFCSTCGGGSSTKPYGHDNNGTLYMECCWFEVIDVYLLSSDEIFDLNFGDPDGYQEWEEEEEETAWEQAEEEFEAYCRYQMEAQENNQHQITSFVMGSTFKKSLLLNRMEVDSDSDSDPEPAVSEEERQKKSQFFLSVKEYVQKHPDLQSKFLNNNLNNSKKNSKQDEKNQRQRHWRGSKKGARRNVRNVQNWNKFDEPGKCGGSRPTVDSANRVQVAVLPDVREVSSRARFNEDEFVSSGRNMSEVLGHSSRSASSKMARGERESEAVGKVKKLVQEITEQQSTGIVFLEHALGLGVDIIYPSLKQNSAEEDEQQVGQRNH